MARARGTPLHTFAEILTRFDANSVLASIHDHSGPTPFPTPLRVPHSGFGAAKGRIPELAGAVQQAESATTEVIGKDEATYVDTDELNASISLAALLLLREEVRGPFGDLDITGPAVLGGLVARPPCRWEQHFVSVPLAPPVIGDSTSGIVTEGEAADDSPEPSKKARIESVESAATASQAGAQGGEGGGGGDCKHIVRLVSEGSAECVTVEVVLDVGHNPAAIEALADRVRRFYSGRAVHMIYGMARDKDVRTCLQRVLRVIPTSNIHFAQVCNCRKFVRLPYNNRN